MICCKQVQGKGSLRVRINILIVLVSTCVSPSLKLKSVGIFPFFSPILPQQRFTAETLSDIFLFNIVSKLTVPSAFERDSVNFCVYSGEWNMRERKAGGTGRSRIPRYRCEVIENRLHRARRDATCIKRSQSLKPCNRAFGSGRQSDISRYERLKCIKTARLTHLSRRRWNNPNDTPTIRHSFFLSRGEGKKKNASSVHHNLV